MRVYFVGSFDDNRPDYAIVQKNFRALVVKLAESQIGFVVRAVHRAPGTLVPIDLVVLDALLEYNNKHSGRPADILLIIEPGVPHVSPSIPHKTHTATSSIRTEFYREILENADFVVGAGGATGLSRFLMVSEWTGKPFHILPGAGGTADDLWNDYFKEALHLTMLNDKMVLQLKRTPYLNHPNDDFASDVTSLLIELERCLRNHPRLKRSIITADTITLDEARRAVKSFSLGLWLVIISIGSFLFTLGYFIASQLAGK